MAGKKDKVKDSDRTSIIVQDLKHCFVCGSGNNIHLHEIFYGSSNRKKSKEDGCVIPLCGRHHNLSSEGIHYNKALDERIKKQAEKIWIQTYCPKEMDIKDKLQLFIDWYGFNYLEEDDFKSTWPIWHSLTRNSRFNDHCLFEQVLRSLRER